MLRSSPPSTPQRRRSTSRAWSLRSRRSSTRIRCVSISTRRRVSPNLMAIAPNTASRDSFRTRKTTARAKSMRSGEKNRYGEVRNGSVSNLEGEGPQAPPQTEATLMLRPESDKPDPTGGKVIVAVNRKTLTEDPAALVTELNDLWEKACSRVSRPDVGWCKAGAVMWDQA